MTDGYRQPSVEMYKYLRRRSEGADTDGQSEDGRRGTATYGDGQTQVDRVKMGTGRQ